ncbi:acyl-CoA thioesterase [Gordonia polyisoprenivorans]|uniref:acyl-CoA thioesterase n=1 Tax=Gordonia polyisoprenivorans TaxID=84595 RepID=UPI001AD781EC|nr:acyl-CoA thioesterase domain-containing protein [Gordonia polyisoprenivorans]QTI70920.1 thioesterase family protein [Gordonia polyisoprenivorans]
MTASGPITDDLRIGSDGRPLSPIHATSAQPARGFGGHVGALALVAAYDAVPEAMTVRYAHIEYIGAAPLDVLPRFAVRSLQDGRTVARRFVEVTHGERLVAVATVAFHHRDAAGPEYQTVMPQAGSPQEAAIEISRPRVLIRADEAGEGRFLTWMRPEILPVADEPRLHEALLLYLSDLGILWPTLSVHGHDLGLRKRALGTVAHSVWFHRRPRVDDWLLFEHTTPSTSSGLGHGEARIFARDGVLLATATQTGLLRPGSAQAWARNNEI